MTPLNLKKTTLSDTQNQWSQTQFDEDNRTREMRYIKKPPTEKLVLIQGSSSVIFTHHAALLTTIINR